MFPACAGVSTPAGEISSEIASVNPVRTAMTSIGARRLTTSDASARACSTNMAQASLSGCTGHQEAPASVAVVSTSTKKHARPTSSATFFRGAHDRVLMRLTLCHRPPATQAANTFGRPGTY